MQKFISTMIQYKKVKIIDILGQVIVSMTISKRPLIYTMDFQLYDQRHANQAVNLLLMH